MERVERGAWVVLDASGRVVAWLCADQYRRAGAREARARAREIAKQWPKSRIEWRG